MIPMSSGKPLELEDYRILSVRRMKFSSVDLSDVFFDSFRIAYPAFDQWFDKKGEEDCYICFSGNRIVGFLYIKLENEAEDYSEIKPAFPPKRRLKIGTFKTAFNRHLLGERLLKVVFDNALRLGVDEIYCTVFEDSPERKWLVNLLEEFGFAKYGFKSNPFGVESVYTRDFVGAFEPAQPRKTFPFFSKSGRTFLVAIYPQYHTDLFPDSILRTESPSNFVENEAYRNAISKVYISRSHLKDLESGDVIVFYRTGGYFAGVVSTVGIVESTIQNIANPGDFIRECRNRSVFSDEELLKHWNYYPNLKPFIVNFLYSYSLPRRINLKRLIELGVIRDVNSVPRGFERLTPAQFESILYESQTSERIIVG
jgi:hypothetical protein